MRNKRISVFIIAALTGMVLICFQVYWLYETFAINRQNFIKTASNDLQKSVTVYTLEQNDHFLSKGDSTFSLFFTDSLPPAKGTKNWTLNKADLSPENSRSIRLIMSGMLSQAANNPVATRRIKELYQSELKKDGIGLGFQFIVFPDSSKVTPESIKARLGITNNSPILVAEFENKTAYFFKANLLNVVVSASLILLTIGCLWYLNSVIIEQARLHRLQTQFINNMAHEFRTPLSILLSTHEALHEFGELADEEKALKYIQANQSVLRKLDGNLDRILKMAPVISRQEKPTIEPVNVYKLVEQILHHYSYRKEVSVTLDFALAQTDILSNHFYLDTIISNLVDNAYKYVSAQPEVVITVSAIDGGWQLEVRDNGPGIAKQDLPYIFDQFYRVSTGDVHDHKGYGLGLNYVKELMSALHGHIDVKSIVGKGTIFTLQFPLSWTK